MSFPTLLLSPPNSRRLLMLHTSALLTLPPSSSTPTSPPNPTFHGTSFRSIQAHVVWALAAVVCSVAITIIVTSIYRCLFHLFVNRRRPEERPCGTTEVPAGVRRWERKKALVSALPSLIYSSAAAASECAICLSEFASGEMLRVLPQCNHVFHARCIDRWLVSRPSCPTCRRCLFGKSDEVAGGVDGGDLMV